MNITARFIRILYGVLFFIFGLNGFTAIIPIPPLADQANEFLGVLIKVKYMMPLWKGVELVTGFAIVFNVFMPLALIILTPVLVNILLFHFYLDPEHVYFPVILFVIHIVLMYRCRQSYQGLLKVKYDK